MRRVWWAREISSFQNKQTNKQTNQQARLSVWMGVQCQVYEQDFLRWTKPIFLKFSVYFYHFSFYSIRIFSFILIFKTLHMNGCNTYSFWYNKIVISIKLQTVRPPSQLLAYLENLFSLHGSFFCQFYFLLSSAFWSSCLFLASFAWRWRKTKLIFALLIEYRPEEH